MRINKRIKLTAIMLVLLLIAPMLSTSAFADADNAKLTIIHVNDRHGRMSADPYLAQMVQDLKGKGENVLLLDAGDSIHGQTVTNLTKGKAMVEVMNAVGYDAMAPGNHDFNFGVPRLTELSKSMKFPLLAANVKTTSGENLFKPYKVFKMKGVTVGVFGISTPETVTKSDPRIVEGLRFGQPVVAATDMVRALKAEGCDVVVALAHLGLDKSSRPSNRSTALASIAGLDVIIDGHSHTLLEEGQKAGNTLIAQTGEFGQNIGVVEISISGGKKEKTARVVAVTEESELVPNEAIAAKIKREEAKIEPITTAVVGYSPVVLEGERSAVRTRETNLSNVVTDSMLNATNADMSFMTGGNIRASIDAGDITMGEVLTTLPFSNLLVTVELSGSDVLKVLEHGVSHVGTEAATLIHVAGVSFTFDPDAQVGQRVRTVTMADGKALDASKTYTVATIEFIAAGGDGFDMLANGKSLVYYGGDADALADYLAAKPDITSEAAGRVSAVKPTVEKAA